MRISLPKHYLPWINPSPRKSIWWAAGAVILGWLIFQFNEHKIWQDVEAMRFLDEIGIVVGIVVISTGAIQLLLRRIEEKTRVMNQISLKHRLSLELANTSDWESLVSNLLGFLSSHAPVSNVSILARNRETEEFDLVGYQTRETRPSEIEPILTNPEAYRSYSLLQIIPSPVVRPEVYYTSSGEEINVYTLPLVHQNFLVAILRLAPDPGKTFSKPHLDRIGSLAPEITVAVNHIRALRQESEQTAAQAVENVRSDIAHDLHDTISQNLNYLRFMLDYLSQQDGFPSSVRTHADLEKMRRVTDESYELVRGMLATLKIENTANFCDILEDQAQIVAERAGFEMAFLCSSNPRALDKKIIRQIFYVFREALSNIEKHAHANKVNIRVDWGESDLTIRIKDDGSGFDPTIALTSRHFGLAFMRERIETFQGRLFIDTRLGEGTEVTVWLPFKAV